MKISKIIFTTLYLLIAINVYFEINDVIHPSDSGDMKTINYLIKKTKSNNGDIESSIHLAIYYNYNADFYNEGQIIRDLINSKYEKSTSQWERILNLALQSCNSATKITPEDMSNGFINAKKYNAETEAIKSLENRWKNGEFLECAPINN